MVEVYTSGYAGRTVPVARRVRNCVLFNVIDPYTRGTSQVYDQLGKWHHDVVRVDRMYIECPFSEKNEAKALGARWDGRVDR